MANANRPLTNTLVSSSISMKDITYLAIKTLTIEQVKGLHIVSINNLIGEISAILGRKYPKKKMASIILNNRNPIAVTPTPSSFTNEIEMTMDKALPIHKVITSALNFPILNNRDEMPWLFRNNSPKTHIDNHIPSPAPSSFTYTCRIMFALKKMKKQTKKIKTLNHFVLMKTKPCFRPSSPL